MIPVGDDEVKGAGLGVLNILFIVLNVLVFVFEVSLVPPTLDTFIQYYGVVPALVIRGYNFHSLLTSMFLHGGYFHLIGNMLFLGVFGDNIEAVLGKTLYLVFYLTGGLAASMIHILFNMNSIIPCVGASGAISAILGAYIVMFPRSRVRLLIFTGYGLHLTRTSALSFLGVWAVSQLLNGVATLGINTAQTGGVAFWAHIGGFAFGLFIGFLFRGRASGMWFETGRRRSY